MDEKIEGKRVAEVKDEWRRRQASGERLRRGIKTVRCEPASEQKCHSLVISGHTGVGKHGKHALKRALPHAQPKLPVTPQHACDFI